MMIETSDVVLNLGLVLMFSVFAISLYRAHTLNGTSYYNKFNLIDLICGRDGRVDRPAFLEMGTWFLMAWGFIVLVNKEQWGLLVGYGGLMTGVFVTRAAHSAWLKMKEDKPESTSLSMTETTKIETRSPAP